MAGKLSLAAEHFGKAETSYKILSHDDPNGLSEETKQMLRDRGIKQVGCFSRGYTKTAIQNLY